MSRKLMERVQQVPAKRALRAGMQWINRMDKASQPVAVTSAGLVFLILCERFGVSPRRALEVSGRQLRDAKDNHPIEVRATVATIRDLWPHD